MKQKDLTSEDLSKLDGIMTAMSDAKLKREEKNVIVEKLIDFFRSTGLKSIRHEDLVIRFSDSYETKQFDPDMVRTKYPEIWVECHSVVVRPPHVSIKRHVPKEVPETEEDDVPETEMEVTDEPETSDVPETAAE